jgi:tetratricopeptide (TPR) repeat protein
MEFNSLNFLKYINENVFIEDDFFIKMINKYPENNLIKLHASYYYLINNKIEECVLIYNNIVKLDLNDYETGFYKLIEILLRDDKEITKDLLSLNKTHPENKFCLLELFFALKDSDSNYLAWGFLEKAIELDPFFYEARLQLVLNYNSIDNSIDIINELLSFPQTFVDTRVLNKLAYAYYNCYEIENAYKIAEGSLKMEATAEAYYVLATIEHNEFNNFVLALDYYNLALQKDPLYLDCINSKAWLLFDMSKNDEAEELFKSIIDLDNTQFSYIQLIQFYFKIGNLEKISDFIKEIELKFGKDYISDSFKILYFMKTNSKDMLNQATKEFKKLYNEDQIKWLKEIIIEYK